MSGLRDLRPAPSQHIPMPDGARLAVWSTGRTGAHPAVILVHGGPGLWDYLGSAARLIDDLTLVHRYDQRGCGESTGVPQADDPGTMATAIDDLAHLITALGHDRVILIGHSFGATLALATAAEHPELVIAVGYVAGVGVGDWRTPFRRDRAAQLAPVTDRLAELDAAERDWEREVEWRTLHWMYDYADPIEGRAHAAQMARTPLPINWRANQQVEFGDDQQRAWARAVKCPVTVIHGSLDPRPLANAVELADLVPVRKKRLLSQASHMVFDDDPEGAADLLREIILAPY